MKIIYKIVLIIVSINIIKIPPKQLLIAISKWLRKLNLFKGMLLLMPMANLLLNKLKKPKENKIHNNTPFLFFKILKIALPQIQFFKTKKVIKISK